jgi:trehalose 6-phosphate synthase
MSRGLRFLVLVVLGLGSLTWAAMMLVNATTRGWSERDIALRSRLAVNASRRALSAHWRKSEWGELRELLGDLTRDERIMAAAACTPNLRTVARTADYPDALSCEVMRSTAEPGLAHDDALDRMSVKDLPGGRVHLALLPVADEIGRLGFAAFVHDWAFVERREATTREFILLVFAVLAAAAGTITLVAARLSWRSWSDQLRQLLRGGAQRPEFRPLMQDVRDLVERLVVEKDLEGEGGHWTPQRLKRTLTKQLHGERILIMANREPYIHTRAPDGTISVLHPASGLVTALEPVMRACSGVWVAHGSGSADRETADGEGRIRVPPGEESYQVRRVWLSREEEQGYYYGFANEGLWPLCHVAHTRPVFRRDDWNHYKSVNQRFADAVCAEAQGDDPIVLVQDYHFALAPRLIRERLPRATIISFWHIPWPNAERLGICPMRGEILEGLLGSSIVGFHTQLHCNNFMAAVERYMEARLDRERTAVVFKGRSSLVRPYPISIEWPNRWAADAVPPRECRAEIFRALGLRRDALLGVGVDRLDYTKGIEERLLAVERLLERSPALRGRFTFVQLAAPSRSEIERYRELAESVDGLAGRINLRFGTDGYRPVVLLRSHHEPKDVFRYLRAADVCYVSSLHDGMNLVAKEFVAARDDERGVLVLSEFTGAARELTEALIVNPYDLEEASSALAMALEMPPEEQRERMSAMRALVAEFNVYRWAGRMLVDATRVRRRERLAGRLANRGSGPRRIFA